MDSKEECESPIELPETEGTMEENTERSEQEAVETEEDGVDKTITDSKITTLESVKAADSTTDDSSQSSDDTTDGLWGDAPTEFNETTGELTVRAGTLSNMNYPNIDLANVEVITFTDLRETHLPVNSHRLFTGDSELGVSRFRNVQTINGSSHLDTSDVKDMSFMFYNARNLTNLDLSEWDTSNVMRIYLVFSNTTKLNSLILGTNFRFKNNSALPNITPSDEYTGK